MITKESFNLNQLVSFKLFIKEENKHIIVKEIGTKYKSWFHRILNIPCETKKVLGEEKFRWKDSYFEIYTDEEVLAQNNIINYINNEDILIYYKPHIVFKFVNDEKRILWFNSEEEAKKVYQDYKQLIQTIDVS